MFHSISRGFSAMHTFILALVLGVFLGLAPQCNAQNASSVNPTAQSVKEDQLLKQLQIEGRGSIPDVKSRVIIQPAGQEWRAFHEGTLPKAAAISILGMLLLLGVFYVIKGKIRIQKGASAQRIERFNGLERFNHWLTASSFIVLGLTGLNVAFGKSLLLPLIGAEAFAGLSQTGKYLHNYLSLPFTIGILVMFLLWLKDNIPNARDVNWFKQGGGLIGNAHPEAGRFNGGQKMIFWIVVLGGTALSISGFFLLFPFQNAGIAGMQTATMVHGLVGVLMIAAILAHIYIGSIGMEGAFDAMGSGQVDLNWAKEHHALWVADEMKKGNAVKATDKPAAAE